MSLREQLQRVPERLGIAEVNAVKMACQSPIAWSTDPAARARLIALVGAEAAERRGLGPVVLAVSRGLGEVFALSEAPPPGALCAVPEGDAEAVIAVAAASGRAALGAARSLAACSDRSRPSLLPLGVSGGLQRSVSGRSLGLSVALWAAAKALGLDLSCDAALGAIGQNGELEAVADVEAKLDALFAVGLGLRRIFAPAAMGEALRPQIAARWPDGEVELVLFHSVQEAVSALEVEARPAAPMPSEEARRSMLGQHLRQALTGGAGLVTAPNALISLLNNWRAAAVAPWDQWAADWAIAIADRHAGAPAWCPPRAQPPGPPGDHRLGRVHLAALDAHFAQTYADAPAGQGAVVELDQLEDTVQRHLDEGDGPQAAQLLGALGRATLIHDPAKAATRLARAAGLFLSEQPADAGRAICAWLIAAGATLDRQAVAEARRAAAQLREQLGATRDDHSVSYAFLDLAEARALLGIDPAAAGYFAVRAAAAALDAPLVYVRWSALRVGWLAAAAGGGALPPSPGALTGADDPAGLVYAGLHALDRALLAGDPEAVEAARADLLAGGGGRFQQLLDVLEALIGEIDLSSEGALAELGARLRRFAY